MTDLSQEICYANNIIKLFFHSSNAFISQNFIHAIDKNDENYKDYSQIIPEPISLTDIKTKTEQNIYSDIREFVCDFRLLFFNCYRYYGVDSKLGKVCAKLESIFEQKLIQLPTYIRHKTTMESILMDEDEEVFYSGNFSRRRSLSSNDARMATPIKAMFDEIEKFGSVTNMFSDIPNFTNDPTNYIFKQLKKWQEKRRKVQMIRDFDNWFTDNTEENDRNILNNSYEFIELVQLLQLMYAAIGLDQLLEPALGIEDVSYEDLEYAVLFPRSSKILSGIVALSCTINKMRLVKIKAGLPDYKEWNEMLIDRLRLIYRSWSYPLELRKNEQDMIRKWNLEERIFKILGHIRSPMDKRQFHEISIWQRCTALLAMFLVTLKQQDSVRSAMDKSIDDWDAERMIKLGRTNDDSEYEYVRFPVLGKLAGYYVYKIRTLHMDPSLEEYYVEYKTSKEPKSQPPKKSRKSQIDPKFRKPTWFIEESCKRSKSKSKPKPKTPKQPKKPVQPAKTPSISRASSRYKLRSKLETNDEEANLPDEITNATTSNIEESVIKEQGKDQHEEVNIEKAQDGNYAQEEYKKEADVNVISSEVNVPDNWLEIKTVSENVEDVKSEPIEPSPSSKDNNEEGNDDEEENNPDTNFECFDQNSESELEPPELILPPEGEIQLIARDLKSITNLETELRNNHNKSGYSLLSEIIAIRMYWEETESIRVDVVNKARIRLRSELDEEHKQETIRQRSVLLKQQEMLQKQQQLKLKIEETEENNETEEEKLDQDEIVEEFKEEESEPEEEEVKPINQKVSQPSVSTRPQRRTKSLRKNYNYDYFEEDHDEDQNDEDYMDDDDDDDDYLDDDDETGKIQIHESRNERYARRLKGDLNPRFTSSQDSKMNLGRRSSTRNRKIKRSYDELSFTLKIKPSHNVPQVAQNEENEPKKKIMKVINYEGDEDNAGEEPQTNGTSKHTDSNQSESSSNPQVAQSFVSNTSLSNNTTNTSRSNRPKQRIFKCRETYFTGNLDPVRVKCDGTLAYLPPASVPKHDFFVARKMIGIYFKRQAELAADASKKIEESNKTDDDNNDDAVNDQEENGTTSPTDKKPDENNEMNDEANTDDVNENPSVSETVPTDQYNGTDNASDDQVKNISDSNILSLPNHNHSRSVSSSDSMNKNKDDEFSFNSCSTIPFCGETQINILYSNGQSE